MTVQLHPSAPTSAHPNIGPQMVAERAALVEQHSPMVSKTVREVSYRAPASVDRRALFSAGIVGLLDAADKYDGNRSVAFEAYARIRVRGAILDELRGLDHLTRTQRRRSRDVAESRRDLEKHGPTSDSAVAEALGMSIEDVQESRRGHVPPDIMDPQAMEMRPVRQLWGDSESVIDRMEHQEQVRCLSQALAQLPERNRLVVGLYYESEITLQEIGDMLGVTQSRISQILKKTMEMLRESVASSPR